jgi:hypothetical protein
MSLPHAQALALMPPQCPHCGRLHRSWARLTECVFRPEWVVGEGEWGSFAWCPRGLTVVLHRTREAAEESRRQVDQTRCGGLCVGNHTVEHVADLAAGRGGAR